MKRFKIAIWMLAMSLGVWAQGQGLQVAAKGGITQWTGQDVQTQLSPIGGIDLGYIMRCRVGRDTQLGLRSGIGLSYSSCQLQATLTDHYEQSDYYPNTLLYTNTASAQEHHQQLQLDLPILFSLQTHGFALNIGPKLLWTASDRYQQTISSANIDAYFPLYDVHVRNEAVTGHLPTPYTTTGTQGLPTLSLALSAEIGYEWQIGYRYSRRSEQFIGIQLYIDYGLKNLISTSQNAFLSVAPITAPLQTPAITVGTIAATTSLHYINAGLRLYYTIQSVDYPGRGWHRYHR